MTFRNLLYEKDGGVTTITINRPEAKNALDMATWREIREAVRQAGSDGDVKVLVITGAGESAFAAGSDLKMLALRSPWETMVGECQQILGEIEQLPVPVVAAINGYALGGGLELALACDLRVATENARLGQPEVRFAFIPGIGGTQRLPRLVGVAKAKELIFTGELIEAREAERIGLVNKVVPLGSLKEAVKDITTRIIGRGPKAIAMAKAALNASRDLDVGSGLLLERALQALLFTSEDKAEGIQAFLEKREPRFRGR